MVHIAWARGFSMRNSVVCLAAMPPLLGGGPASRLALCMGDSNQNRPPSEVGDHHCPRSRSGRDFAETRCRCRCH